MKQLGLIDFNDQPEGCQHVATYTNVNGLYADYAINNNYLFIYLFKNKFVCTTYRKNLNISDQIEFPVSTIYWVIKSIEKFVTPEDKGGLSKGQNWIKDTIENEELFIRYGVNIGGEFREGLTISNLSRADYIDSREPQQVQFSYDLLFKCGLFNLLKQLADKLEV